MYRFGGTPALGVSGDGMVLTVGCSEFKPNRLNSVFIMVTRFGKSGLTVCPHQSASYSNFGRELIPSHMLAYDLIYNPTKFKGDLNSKSSRHDFKSSHLNLIPPGDFEIAHAGIKFKRLEFDSTR